MGVSAADFTEAAEVDWGSASGPAPIGTGTPIGGEVLAPRWLGWSMPVRPTLGAPPEPAEGACRSVLVIGVRGSGESPQGSQSYSSGELNNVGSQVLEVVEGLEAKLASSSLSLRALAVRYPALKAAYLAESNVALAANRFSTDGPFLDNIWEGVAAMKTLVEREEHNCPGSSVVLAGYSGGALIIRLALAELGSASLTPVAAVVLVADPTTRPTEAVVREGSAQAGAEGLYTRLFGAPALPASLLARTFSMCNARDIVCAPGPGAEEAAHERYEAAELKPLGALAGEAVLTR